MGLYDYTCDHTNDPIQALSGETSEHGIGDVIIAFEELDDAMRSAISGVLNQDDENGRIVISLLSLRLTKTIDQKCVDRLLMREMEPDFLLICSG